MFGFLKKMFSPVVSVNKHVDGKNLLSNFKQLFLLTKTIFSSRAQNAKQETFTEAIQRLNLSEQELLARQKMFCLQSWMFLIIFLGLFAYLFYQLQAHHILASLMVLILSIISLLSAIRARLWFFQVKTRQLGYSLEEWFKQDILGSKKHEKI